MTGPYALSGVVIAGVVACGLALLIGTYLVATPPPFRVSAERRRPGLPHDSGVKRVVEGAAEVMNTLLRRRRDTEVHVAVLERAGVTVPLQDFVLVMFLAAAIVFAAAAVMVDLLVGVALGVAVPLLARGVLGLMAKRRQHAFADQLDDTLQLMSGSMRAGQSLMQALRAVARDADEPTSVEFSRVLNEARVGRELGHALDETAARMASEDFVWVSQAIAINREAGGNLAEVLDQVGHTIRERNQVRRQVQSLSAEGKLSAWVLIALPVGVTGFLSVTNPSYLAKFTDSITGYALIVAAVLLLVVGCLWLRKVVSFKF